MTALIDAVEHARRARSRNTPDRLHLRRHHGRGARPRVAARRPDRRRAARDGMAPADNGGAQLALMNPGGIRADLVYAASGSEGDGVVTYGEGFTVQPFTNMVNLVDLTGAQLITGAPAAGQRRERGVPEDPPGLQGPHLHPGPDEDRRGPGRHGLGQAERRGDRPGEDLPRRDERVPRGRRRRLHDPRDRARTSWSARPTWTALDAYLTANSSATDPLAPPAADRITVVD